jgi:hypothetical protein
MDRLTRTMPAETTDDELEDVRLELLQQAVDEGTPADQLWSGFITQEDGSYEVAVGERPSPWE